MNEISVEQLIIRYDAARNAINSMPSGGDMSRAEYDKIMQDKTFELIYVSTELGRLGYALENGVWYPLVQTN